MELTIAITSAFLFLTAMFYTRGFRLYVLPVILLYVAVSIEFIADVNGLTFAALTVFISIRMAYLRLKIFDIAALILVTLPCVFWLNTREFTDGFVYSYVLTALGLAIACNLLFEKQKRQTLCALALLMSLFICRISQNPIYVADVVSAFAVAMIFTQNYTLTTDSMTIDSYGTSS